MQLRILIVLALVMGCKGKKDGDKATERGDAPSPTTEDLDGDGVTEEDGDCDDEDEWVYPGRTEDCDGIDDNCNGLIDEGFTDVDGDDIADCVDSEECDGIDNDGDGEVDEGFDRDGDGLADCPTEEVCDGVDNDEDGLIDEGFDEDGDGFNACGDRADCDDRDPDVHPDAVEVAGDLTDNDCDLLVDEGLWAAGDLVISEVMFNPNAVRDTDGEWFELTNRSGRMVALNGLELRSDGDESVRLMVDDLLLLPPGAQAVLGNNADPASNGFVDVDAAYVGVFLSNESDRISVLADGVLLDAVSWDDGATMPDPSGYSLNLDPSMTDSVDNDDPMAWCTAGGPWADGSDWGSPGMPNDPCPQFDGDGDGWTGEAGDCDDTDAAVYPGAPEVSVGVDNDCDGVVAARPVANADYDLSSSSLVAGGSIYLDGTGSYDPDGGGLSYAWTVDEMPEGSGGWISDSSSSMPWFYPDIPGVYGVSLVVSDGALESSPSRITFEID